MRQEIGEAVSSSVARSLPPVGVVGATVAGVPLDAWVLILTAMYIVLQSAYLVWRWLREARRR